MLELLNAKNARMKVISAVANNVNAKKPSIIE